jgi:hypothetical protein
MEHSHQSIRIDLLLSTYELVLEFFLLNHVIILLPSYKKKD